MRVLAVGAHPDDVELGCGGTLLRHHERRDEITVLVMTGGERGVYDARSRRNEQQYAAALTGATLIWGGFADGAVPPGPEAIAVVDRAVARSGAEILYTHAPDDSHQDHIATSSVCLAAARRVPTVLYYETPSTLEFMPTVFIDLDDVMDRKIGLVRAHLSRCCATGPSTSMRSSPRRGSAVPRAGRSTPRRSAPRGSSGTWSVRPSTFRHARRSRNRLASTGPPSSGPSARSPAR